jgi:hypothetical protein
MPNLYRTGQGILALKLDFAANLFTLCNFRFLDKNDTSPGLRQLFHQTPVKNVLTGQDNVRPGCDVYDGTVVSPALVIKNIFRDITNIVGRSIFVFDRSILGWPGRVVRRAGY